MATGLKIARRIEELVKRKYPDKKISAGFILVLLFIGGIIINPAYIFPMLRPLRLQFLFGILASIMLIFGILNRSQKLNWTGIQTFFTLFLLASLVSLLNLKEEVQLVFGLEAIDKVFKCWLMLVLISAYISNIRLFEIGFKFFLFVVGLFQIHSLKAIFFGVSFVEGRFDSWLGQISNSDFVGTFFAIIFPIHLEILLKKRTWFGKLVFFLSAVIDIFILVKTQTRAAFLSLIVISILWLLRMENIWKRFTLLFVTILIVVIFGILGGGGKTFESFIDRMETVVSSQEREKDFNIQSRIALWKEGIEIWSQFPLIGCGLGGLDEYQTIEENFDPTGGSGLTKHSLHQSFIQVLADRGLFGGISWGLFIFYIFFYLWKISRACKEEKFKDLNTVRVGIQLGMIGFIVGSFFMSMAENWIMILLAGFTCALYNSIKYQKESLPPSMLLTKNSGGNKKWGISGIEKK